MKTICAIFNNKRYVIADKLNTENYHMYNFINEFSVFTLH